MSEVEEDLLLEDTPVDYSIDPTIKLVQLGLEAQDFFKGALGRHLINRAKHDVALATQALVDADPEDAKQNRLLRNKIYAPKRALSWIQGAVREGELAEKQIIDEDLEQP